MTTRITTTLLLAAAPLAAPAAADVVTIGASKDNTLYQNDVGDVSNGAGSHFFVGRTAQSTNDDMRRGLIEFDVAAAVPAGSTVTDVTLTLYMSKTVNGAQGVTLHRASVEWGEGASDAVNDEGGGTSAEPGDATWLHTFYPGSFWASPGGDYAASASASTSVSGLGFYSWSSAQLALDVQAWLADPAGNHGWLVRGNEATLVTAKRFDTREVAQTNRRPELSITFTPPPGTPYCFGTGCPCANDDRDAGCENNTGAGAALISSGSASVSADDLVLSTSGLPVNNFGIYYMGPDPASAPFGNGLRCVEGVVQRYPVQSTGTGTMQLGPGLVLFSCTQLPPAFCISAFSTWSFQAWYRDPGGPCSASFNFSNAISVAFAP